MSLTAVANQSSCLFSEMFKASSIHSSKTLRASTAFAWLTLLWAALLGAALGSLTNAAIAQYSVKLVDSARHNVQAAISSQRLAVSGREVKPAHAKGGKMLPSVETGAIALVSAYLNVRLSAQKAPVSRRLYSSAQARAPPRSAI